jgi:uncharacterized membrane protein YphA (DoxX/SURF4 family)
MLWVAQVLIAVAFLAATYPKVTLDPMAVEGFATMGFSAAGTLIIGCLEVAGAIGLLVPRLTGLAALGVVALMIGATVATTLTMGVLPALMPAVLGVIGALVARGRWYQTVEHISSVRAFATAR